MLQIDITSTVKLLFSPFKVIYWGLTSKISLLVCEPIWDTFTISVKLSRFLTIISSFSYSLLLLDCIIKLELPLIIVKLSDFVSVFHSQFEVTFTVCVVFSPLYVIFFGETEK